jgi:hypothetical protein
MDLQRALGDLAEVRDRLAHAQRFEGYSAPAAAASGVCAIFAGVLQLRHAPAPHSAGDFHAYLAIWLTCLAVSLALNYGAAAAWLVNHRGPGTQSRFRSAALSIAPSIVLGGALSAALVSHSLYALLPGTWFAFYAIGLFASRGVIPSSCNAVTAAFTALALVFLMTPLEAVALAWWVMPLGFGLGQLAIGYLLWRSPAS